MVTHKNANYSAKQNNKYEKINEILKGLCIYVYIIVDLQKVFQDLTFVLQYFKPKATLVGDSGGFMPKI